MGLSNTSQEEATGGMRVEEAPGEEVPAQEGAPAESPAVEQPAAGEPAAEEQEAEEPLAEVPEAEETAEEQPQISQPLYRWAEVADPLWVLVGYGDALNPTVVEEGIVITVTFSSVDGQLSGSGGCNNYFDSGCL